jgi:hypothetical protein
MQENINSSKHLLEELSKRIENGGFNAEKIYDLSIEIERKMEEFEISKKKKAAQSEQDLSKLVITA